ncbi:MAG TPA: phage tail protein [Longimicrobium sp.]|jgi:hypothetical protein
MSSPLGKIVAGAALIGVQFIPGVGQMVSAAAFSLGASFVASGVGGLLAGRLRGGQEGFQTSATSAQADVPVIYGTVKMAPNIVDIRVDPNNNKILAIVGVLGVGSDDGNGIQAIDEIYLDDKLAVSASGVVQSAFVGNSTIDGATARVRVAKYMGTFGQSVDAEMSARFSSTGWPSSSRGRGMAYVRLLLTYDNEKFPGGIPRIACVVRGRRVFDPRDSTWKHAENPALCVRDYLLSTQVGLGASTAEIDEASFAAAANYCDETLSVPGGVQKRFTCNAILATERARGQNLNDLLSSCRGQLVYQGGVYRLFIRRPTTPTAFALTEDNIVGNWSFRRAGLKETANTVRVAYVDSGKNYVVETATWPEPGAANPYRTADNGFANEVDVDLPCTTNRYAALQIAEVLLKESRNDLFVSLTAKEAALQLQVGDVVPVTHSTPGWTAKPFWVLGLSIRPDHLVEVVLQAYSADTYTLSTPTTTATLPGGSLPDPQSVAAPSGLVLTADATTALEVQDGIRVPRIRVQWTASPEPHLLRYEIEIKPTAGGVFNLCNYAGPQDTEAFVLSEVSAGVGYDVRVRAVSMVYVASNWISGSVTPSTTVSNYGGNINNVPAPTVQGEARTGRRGVGNGARNVLVNGSAQRDAEGLTELTAVNSLTIDTATFYRGDRSFKLSHASAADEAWAFPQYAVADGDYVTVRGRIKTTALPPGEAGEGAALNTDIVSGVSSLTVLETRSAGVFSFVADVGLPADGVARDFTEVWAYFQVNGAGVLRLAIHLGYNGAQSGSAWFDDIEVIVESRYATEGATRSKAGLAAGTGQLASPAKGLPYFQGNRGSAIKGYSGNLISTTNNGDGTATVSLAAHTHQFGQMDVNYNSGTVTLSGVAALQEWFVYTDDLNLAGGAATYLATQSEETAKAGNGRVFVGIAGVPASGATTPGTPGGGTTLR